MDKPLLTTDRVREVAVAAGFASAGVASLPHALADRDAARFEAFVQAGHAGQMDWLVRSDSQGHRLRARTENPYPWARSIIVFAANYDSAQPMSVDAAPAEAGWISRYAWSGRPKHSPNPEADNPEADAAKDLVPSDYHKVLLKRVRSVEAVLKRDLGPFESRAYVDTGPVMERALAVAAGLGWTGKNTCLIHPDRGSFSFLAILLTSLDYEGQVCEEPVAASAIVPDRCGSCRRCIEACPTDALIAPYQMDARLCISYLTIEHEGPIGEELMGGMGRQVFGCDICQDVCPWNQRRHSTRQQERTEEAADNPNLELNRGRNPERNSARNLESNSDRKSDRSPALPRIVNTNAPRVADPLLIARQELVNPALAWLGSLDELEFERTFNGSPVRRAGFLNMRRNVAIAMGNSRLAEFATTLEQWVDSVDEGVRTAAQWALRRVVQGSEDGKRDR